MSGNVWEWCWDWYGSYPNGCPDQSKGADEGSDRVYRGGSWNEYPRGCRAAYRRTWLHPAFRDGHVGFRLALSSR
jgi:formylglycine-generating enzyme required for sulfatase activity